jgi:hypothetical protein
MFKSRSGLLGLLTIVFFLNLVGDASASETTQKPQIGEYRSVQVVLDALHHTISWDSRDPEQTRFDLPVLYLRHERTATRKIQRTLSIAVSKVALGSELKIEVTSLNTDVTTGKPHVAARRFVIAKDPFILTWTFDPAHTPSDLYRLRLMDGAGNTLWENPHAGRPDFALLDTWDVALGAVSDKAYTVRIIYATLFPFARGENDLDNRLHPAAVTDFIERQFVPIVVDTWDTQFVEWGFGKSINPQWDTDNVIEIVITDHPFALFDGTGTYSRFTGEDGQPYPERRIWWYPNSNSFQAYDTLENGYKVIFSHEFFHLMQWNVLLKTGRPSNLRISAIESQGRVAPTIQYPELELGTTHTVVDESAYTSGANRFLSQHLNTSYSALEAEQENKYDAAPYWRFLYEQYNDMAIVRSALTEMAYHHDSDIVSSMHRAMDAAFADVEGPFASYEDSLIAFSRANYALRLGNGRCKVAKVNGCDGLYYDPDDRYVAPPLAVELYFDGAELTYNGAIPSSYGMDFIEVRLTPKSRQHTITVQFVSKNAVDRFAVQVWQLGYGNPRLLALTPQPVIVPPNRDGAYVYRVPVVETQTYAWLGLIITRLDADEALEPLGEYSITIE